MPRAEQAATEIDITVLSKALLDQVLIGDQIRLLGEIVLFNENIIILIVTSNNHSTSDRVC